MLLFILDRVVHDGRKPEIRHSRQRTNGRVDIASS